MAGKRKRCKGWGSSAGCKVMPGASAVGFCKWAATGDNTSKREHRHCCKPQAKTTCKEPGPAARV
eukprot:12036323-Alexandrium_andersonii.AAC.1